LGLFARPVYQLPTTTMNVTYTCPACHRAARAAVANDTTQLVCSHCGLHVKVPDGAVADGMIRRCLVCPSHELFQRKDFPQRLGVALVVLGFIGSSIAWAYYQVFLSFGILFATALVDLVLYVVMGESLTCYRCHAQYRGFPDGSQHGGFDLETHERHRQIAARIKTTPQHTAPHR
jgi:hypothetical protein